MNVNLSLRDLQNHLTNKGWELVRTDGDHDIYSHTKSTLKISVPKKHKKGIKNGTMRQILRKAGTFDK